MEALNQNFLFHASLGSKELFHSNMLAWFLKQTNPEGRCEAFELFLKCVAHVNCPSLSQGDVFITREENHIDLILKWRSGNELKYVFVENKFKSIPTANQLTQYSTVLNRYSRGKTTITVDGKSVSLNRSKSNVFLLLTPFPSPVSVDLWVSVSYIYHILPFLKGLQSFTFKDQERTQIHIAISTYTELIERLLDILNNFHLGSASLGRFLSRPYDFYNHSVITNLRQLRLHDLVLKLAHQQMAILISDGLQIQKEGCLVQAESDLWTDRGKVWVNSGFTMSTGITEVKINSGDNYLYVLQLQGTTLRYALEVKEKKWQKDLIIWARDILLQKQPIWFCDPQTGEILEGHGKKKTGSLLVPEIKNRNGKDLVFNSYGSGFIYLKKDISSFASQPISSILNLIVLETKRIIQMLDHCK